MSKRSVQGLKNRTLKLRYIDSAKKLVNQLQDENERLKNDPETIVGQLIPQLQQAISQNKKLSVLTAAIIEKSGGNITVSKAALESFESKVLSIKWAMPEGVDSVDKAEELIFSYEALTQEEATERQTQQGTLPSPQITVSPEQPTTESEDISSNDFKEVSDPIIKTVSNNDEEIVSDIPKEVIVEEETLVP